MHKRRIRKKLGQRYKASEVRSWRALAPISAAAIVAAGAARVARIHSSFGLPAVTKATGVATTTIDTMLAAAKPFDKVREAEALDWEHYYRKKYDYPEA